MSVLKNVNKEDIAKLISKGFISETPKTIYEGYRLRKNGISLILYNSGKLLIRGKEEAVEKVILQLEKLKIGELVEKIKFLVESGWIIGSDETLKGDTFGGLVVAAVKANDEIRTKLKEIGVADSKKLQDKEIIKMAEEIKKIAPCQIRSLLPEEYNHNNNNNNNNNNNITSMLNKLHLSTAKYLGCGKHVVDKYPGCTVGDIITIKAESKYLEVAAASVLARATGLQQLNRLSLQVGFTIPKGSTHVIKGLEKLKKKGLNFNKFVKTGFKNVKTFLQK